MGSSSTERVSEEWINIYNRVLDTLHQRKNLSFVCKNKKWQFGRNTRLFHSRKKTPHRESSMWFARWRKNEWPN
jgi:hypothetical protein